MKLHHIALRTPDPERLARFYEQVLGMRRIREQPGYSIWLALDDAILMLERSGPHEPGIPAGSLELLAFAADATRKACVRAGLAQAAAPVEAETEHTLYFRDPDGRRIGLSSFPLPACGEV